MDNEPSTYRRIAIAGVLGLGLAAVSGPPGPGFAQGVESNAGAERASSSPSADESSSGSVWLGVQITERDGSEGAPIARIIGESPAARSDLGTGDILLTVGEQKVEDLESLRAALATRGPGDEIDLRVRRDGEVRTISVVLGSRPTDNDMLREQFVGAPLPTMQLERLTGESMVLDGDRDRPLVVEFWATWCPPCRRTQQHLGELGQEFGDGLDIVGISPEAPERIRAYRDGAEVSYPLVHDTGRSADEQLMVSSYPTLFVVDSDGTIAEVFTGADHREALESTLRELIE
jgi:thiol-disulfide isomerase/thioredoxin